MVEIKQEYDRGQVSSKLNVVALLVRKTLRIVSLDTKEVLKSIPNVRHFQWLADGASLALSLCDVEYKFRACVFKLEEPFELKQETEPLIRLVWAVDTFRVDAAAENIYIICTVSGGRLRLERRRCRPSC